MMIFKALNLLFGSLYLFATLALLVAFAAAIIEGLRRGVVYLHRQYMKTTHMATRTTH